MTDLRIIVPPDRTELRIERVGGAHVLTHRLPPNARPTIHPIVAPDGQGILTEDGPSHHPWQRGLYTGFNVVNGVGFWRNEAKDGTFEPRLVGQPEVRANVVRWSLTNLWRHPDGTHMITETQSWTLKAEADTYALDLEWKLRAEVDIEIAQHMAGGLLIRMPFAAERGARALSSEGREDLEVERQRARWVALSMPIEGRDGSAGIALMDHPSNPEHPITWRIDEFYGLSPSRTIVGPWQIPQGDVDAYRFRAFVYCTDIVPADIEAAWNSFISNGDE